MSKLGILKFAVEGLVMYGVDIIVGSVVNTFVDPEISKVKKVAVYVGSKALSGYISNKVGEYAVEQIEMIETLMQKSPVKIKVDYDLSYEQAMAKVDEEFNRDVKSSDDETVENVLSEDEAIISTPGEVKFFDEDKMPTDDKDNGTDDRDRGRHSDNT